MVRPGARTVAVAILGLAMTAGCGGSSAPSTDEAALQATMSRYMSAVKAGNFDAAMRERCSKARLLPMSDEFFLAQAETLFAAAAPSEVKVTAAARVKIDALDKDLPAVNFDYTVVSKAGTSEPLHGVAVIEDNTLRLCGYAPPRRDEIERYLERPVAPGRRPSQATRALIPDVRLAEYEAGEIEATPERAGAPEGRVESWRRTWERAPRGAARVTATRYDTALHAQEAMGGVVHALAADAATEIVAADLPTSIGLRVLSSGDTWLQPPGDGYVTDAMYLLFGDTVVSVSVSSLAATDSHRDVLTFARAVAALATR